MKNLHFFAIFPTFLHVGGKLFTYYAKPPPHIEFFGTESGTTTALLTGDPGLGLGMRRWPIRSAMTTAKVGMKVGPSTGRAVFVLGRGGNSFRSEATGSSDPHAVF